MDDIIRLMVGRELTNQFPPKTNKPGDVALEVEHLSGMYSILRKILVSKMANVSAGF